MAKAKDVAAWMMGQLNQEKLLYQDTAAYQIIEKFGEDFVYINKNGNYAIDKSVLREFRKINEGEVVWERGERLWRFRTAYDDPDKRQQD